MCPSPAWPKITPPIPLAASACLTPSTYSGSLAGGTAPSSMNCIDILSCIAERIGLAACRSSQIFSSASGVRAHIHVAGARRTKRGGKRLGILRGLFAARPLDFGDQNCFRSFHESKQALIGAGRLRRVGEERSIEQLTGAGSRRHRFSCRRRRISRGIERSQARCS